MKYASNPYKLDNNVPDFTSIVLNENLVQAINGQQQLTNVQSLYNEAISKMYESIPLQDLVELLWKIYKKSDVESFITMTRSQLALFGRYRLDKIEDPYYVLLATHCFFKIKTDVFFSRLNQYTQHLLNISIKNTPSSLQYLLGKQEFCLCNHNCAEIIYQIRDNKANETINSAVSLPWNKYDSVGLMQAIFEETAEDNLADLNLVLVNKHLWGYFHRLPGYNNRVAANTTADSKLENFLWSVELVDDHQLVFEQEEYLLCRNGSFLYGSKERTIYDKECQWRAVSCDGKTGSILN